MYLETDAEVLATSLIYLTYFIQKYSLKGHSIKKFSSILGIGSYVWRLLQTVSETGWDRLRISSQPDVSTLMKAIRTIYGPVPIPILSPDVEMVVGIPEVEEVTFTLITN